MFTKRSVISILLASLVLGFTLSLDSNLSNFSSVFLTIFLVIFVNVLCKEFAAYYYDLKIEHKFWEIQKYGVKAHEHFKRPFPLGAVLPLITWVFSAGYFVWLNILYFDSKPEVYRVAKRRGYYTYSESSEFHEGIVAFAGVVGTVLIGLLGIMIGFPEFTKLSFFYAFFCSIPLGKLDGNKILFSESVLSKIAIVLTLGLSLIGIFYLNFSSKILNPSDFFPIFSSKMSLLAENMFLKEPSSLRSVSAVFGPIPSKLSNTY